MWKVAVIGSLLVDIAVRTPRLPQRGDNIHVCDFRMGAGGKGGNAAVAISRLGGSALAIGCIGDDDLGRLQLAALGAEGIDVSGVTAVPGAKTAVAIVLVENDGQNAVLVADRTNELLTGAMVREALEPHWENLDALLVNFECARDAVSTAVMLGQQHRTPVVIDPAPAQPFEQGIWGMATVLTPNRSEAAALVGYRLSDERDVRRAARQLHRAGPDVVVVKLGTEGAYLCTDEDEIVVPALEVNVVDTTGAGDAFTAALIASLLEGRSWRDGIRFANAAGALATTRFGTVDAMPTRAEIEAALSQPGHGSP
jgi:ribokinase